MKDIIEGLNKWWEKKERKGHFVLRTFESPSPLKLFKICNVEVYFIYNRNKELLVNFQVSGRHTSESEDKKFQKELNETLVELILDLTYSNKLEKYGI